MKALDCPEGSSLAIFGGGSVGLAAVMGAVVRGCGTIIVVEPMASRRDMALELGATHVIDPVGTNVAQAVRDIVPAGVEFAFDTSGLKSVIADALTMLASGGTLGLVGVAAPGRDLLDLPINQLIGSGLRIMGIIEGDVVPDRFIPEMVALYRAGRFPFDKLIRTYRLDEINQAIKDQHDGLCIKPILIP